MKDFTEGDFWVMMFWFAIVIFLLDSCNMV